MNAGIIRFTKPGTDEIIKEVPMCGAFTTRAKLKLMREIDNGNSDEAEKIMAVPELFGYYVALIAADRNGIKNVLPKKLTADAILDAAEKIDAELIEPGDEAEAVDENPTGTSGASF